MSPRDFNALASSRGDGLRPELQSLFERLAAHPLEGLVARSDGMTQSGPDPIRSANPRQKEDEAPTGQRLPGLEQVRDCFQNELVGVGLSDESAVLNK